eukprot:TRINITY_DN24909_c0_g1_i1.p1 TRINITY_DN24909_c0_g1~~TRINITY_DN24909_c0_g1_i1.p1  ORF type:complete len:153 (-),score=33.81 TRINITY_DN24909_c0_g1_i1:36-494(-)
MSMEMSKDIVHVIKGAFDLFDKDNDRKLSIDDLRFALEALELKDIAEADLREMMEEVVEDFETGISFEEFLSVMLRMLNGTDIDLELQKAFEIFDKDGDGEISLIDLGHVIKSVDSEVSDETIGKIMNEVRKEEEEFINYEEFVKAFHQCQS